MLLRVVKDSTVQEFLNRADSFLSEQEAANSLMLGICQGLSVNAQFDTPVHLYRVLENERTVMTAVQTPPYNLIVSFGQKSHIAMLVNFLFDHGVELPGVVGPEKESTYFAELWTRMTAQRFKLGMDQRIYSLEKVFIPKTEGTLLPALEEHTELVSSWLYEFGIESLPENEKSKKEDCELAAIKAISVGDVFLWIAHGEPVSVAHLGRPTKNGISIRAVYTPPHFRKNGYGSSVVAHLSQKSLDGGKEFCVLYTDATNATSNKIYQHIGYNELTRSKHFIFESK